MNTALLILHLLGATVWTGGHLVLCLGILPQALRAQDPQRIIDFEAVYERLGLPALAMQVVTGLLLAAGYVPVGQWFNPSNPMVHVLWTKGLLLLLTVGFALHARLRLIPNLSAPRLKALAWHIGAVTVTSVLFVIVGVMFRVVG
jgi:putative copper export protein